MFDWMFAAAWNSIVSSLRITFWLIRLTVWSVSALLNWRQRRPAPRPTDLMDKTDKEKTPRA